MEVAERMTPTICDTDAEKRCKKTLTDLLTQTVEFVDEIKAFFELERSMIQKMWQLSVKLRVLMNSDPPGYYPEDAARFVRTSVLSSLNTYLREHNIKLSECEKELNLTQNRYRAFRIAALKVDFKADLKIISGNEYQRPLTYYLEKGEEIISHAKMILVQLRTQFNEIVPEDCSTLEKYKKAFTIAIDFFELLNEFYVYATIYLKYKHC